MRSAICLITQAVSIAQVSAQAHSNIAFTVERYEEREPHPHNQLVYLARIQFPWQRQPQVKAKVEITRDEEILLERPPREILHGYGEPWTAHIPTYRIEEIVAEKLRATRQSLQKLHVRGWTRTRARDFYDLLNPIPDVDVMLAELRTLLEKNLTF